MATEQRRPILGQGERYVTVIKKPHHGRTPEPPRTYEQARAVIREGILTSLQLFHGLPQGKKLPNEAVLCLRLHPDVTAKTYDPTALFEDAPQLHKVGSRTYRESTRNVTPTQRIAKLAEDQTELVAGRMLFVQSTPEGFRRFVKQLDRPESRIPRLVKDELRRVERFDILSSREQILGFDPSWHGGRVELIFHPTRTKPEQQLRFVFDLFDEIGVADRDRSLREYAGGPTFASCLLLDGALEILRDVNPLRAVHPLSFGGLEDLRTAPIARAPKPPTSTTRSTIKVGIFDGGVDLTVPLLRNHVEEDLALSVTTPPDPQYIAHGTAVAGAVLYGAINGVPADSRLPDPPVSVVSFRVFPTSDPSDIDLYEAIDVIERAVPARKDITTFNISFGPRGPILDDTISRFTYVLDALAVAHKVGFVVAVGNDGNVSGYDRIQSPSDLVHGLGVGAFSLKNGNPAPASYSCKGPGRECGKIKPDVVAFGGCEDVPIHLVSVTHDAKLLAWGTSFAAPLVARANGQAANMFERSSALLARALVVHSARHPDGRPDDLLGHGCIPDDIGTLLTCDDDAVTLIFQGEILPKTIIRLPIPWPKATAATGKVQFRWTVAGLPPVDPNHPSDYTCGCLEDTFYPNERRWRFTDPTKKKHKVLDIEMDKATVAAHRAQGWTQSALPVTQSGNSYMNEADRRAIDCKWEPLVSRAVNKESPSIWQPFLTLQAIGRNTVPARFDYAVVLSIRAPKYNGDLYTDIRTSYPALVPIRVRTDAEIRVRI